MPASLPRRRAACHDARHERIAARGPRPPARPAAIAGAFFTQGLVFISLTTRLPRFQDRWDLGELALSGVLLMMVLLAGVGSLVAERLAPRLDSAVVLRAGLLVIASRWPWWCSRRARSSSWSALAAYGVGLGLVDAAGNMQAVALEHRIGTGRAAVVPRRVDARRCRRRGADPRDERSALVGRRSGGGRCRWRPPPRRTSPATTARPPRSTETDVPWRAIVMIGLALVVFYTVDTAAATWGPVYLDGVFDAPEDLVALATLPYLVASGLVRLVGDRLTEQVGAVRLLRAGAAIAFVALALVVAAPVVAGGRGRLHAARLRGRGRGAAELLRRRGPRRSATLTPADAARAGGRRGGRGSTSSTTPVRCWARS